jgi:membrane fusion protein, multidrug efflux system
MRKPVLFGVVALALGLGAFWWLQRDRTALQAKPMPNSGIAAIPVTAGLSTQQDAPVYVHGLGTVQAYNSVTVRSRVDGQIMQAFFTEGQEVRKGDPLFQIDARPFESALAQATAAKQKDEAQLASAEADLQRFTRLLKSGFQTQQSYDSQKALVGQIEAAIKADDAQIDSAWLNLDYADIRAPISGRTGARLVDAGNLIRASDGTALVTITQLKPIFISFSVPQDRLGEILRNPTAGPLKVQALSAEGGQLLDEGILSLVDNQVDTATGTIHLKATYDNPDERLWPGEFVDARLILSIRKNVITTPATAVQQGPNGYYAYVVRPNDTVERRAVQVAGFQDGRAIITAGLPAGQRIVVEGQYRLTDGAKVRVSPPQPPPAKG